MYIMMQGSENVKFTHIWFEYTSTEVRTNDKNGAASQKQLRKMTSKHHTSESKFQSITNAAEPILGSLRVAQEDTKFPAF